MSKPASIQTIKEVKNHPHADKLDIITVLGWQCVTGKGNFRPGDKCVYLEIDSVCPDKPMFEFLRSRHFRIKTIKLRGELSQGLCLPLSDFPELLNKEIGDDVSEIIGVTHYVKEIPIQMQGTIAGNFPEYIPKTDEERVQNIPDILNELSGKSYYITEKADGTSATYYFHNEHFGVCGRNYEYKFDEKQLYWKIAKKYDLESRLKNRNVNIAIQGEICGPAIQKNRLNLEEIDFFLFNIFDINNKKYLGYHEQELLIKELGLKSVKLLELGENFSYSLEQLIEKAEGKYNGSNNNREGIVVRSTENIYSNTNKGRMSFKVINNSYLLKDEE